MRFIISGPKVEPEKLSALVNIVPDRSARKRDERRNIKGALLGYEENGWWSLESTPRLRVRGIRKKDINEHIDALLKILLPHKVLFNKLSENSETLFDVLWKSTYLYAGTGPCIDAHILRGMAELNAGIAFDIYQVNEDEE